MVTPSDVVTDVGAASEAFIPFAERDSHRTSADECLRWEWTVERDSAGGSAGVCETCRGAIEALSKALIERRRPGCGSVVPVVLLVGAIREEDQYQRLPSVHTAVYEQGAIQWS
jgi:hypothetical protein